MFFVDVLLSISVTSTKQPCKYVRSNKKKADFCGQGSEGSLAFSLTSADWQYMDADFVVWPINNLDVIGLSRNNLQNIFTIKNTSLIMFKAY